MTASYTFLPWVQGGIARSIADADEPKATLAAKVTLPVSVHVDGAGDAPVKVKVFGPGDVTGLEPAQIVRRDPAPGATRFEAGYMPQVQFARADLPWLFTPAAPGTGKTRLRPWLVLVTVTRANARITPGAPLPVLELGQPAAELPDLSQSWAWAHAQITGLPGGARPTDVLAADPGRTCSRLVCPRHLQPDTAYLACLVPAFAIGVQAGLGQPITDESRLDPAWPATPQGPLRLPVYDSWDFVTGPAGSFETLATRLHASPVTMIAARLNLNTPGGGLPAGGVIGMQSALRPPGPDSPPPGPGPAFTDALQRALNADGLAPPRYGSLQGDLTAPWLATLNLDPRLRIAASAGARVVQERQEELMARAWEQAGAVKDANARLRGAQVARELGQVLIGRIDSLSAAACVALTQPAHAGVALAESTIDGELRGSRVPQAAVSGAMRRIASPQGLIARRARSTAGVNMLAATDDVAMSPPAAPPGGMVVFTPSSSLTASFQTAAVVGADPRHALSAEQLKAQLLAGLAPEATVLARTRAAIAAPESTWTRPDPLEPANAGPRFPEAMFDGLQRAAPELFLPGVKDVDSDGVALLETSPAVIEAYMAGLNHELSRELLWREFPATLSGTAFRQFWESDTEDIPPLADWGATALGTHVRGGSNQLVLLVRSELLRRFPTTTIYAAKATASGTLDAATRLAPMFRAALPPDIVCVGFALSEAAALTAPGWYFVFEQFPGEPRFGFDETAASDIPKTADALAWAHVPVNASGHADVEQTLKAAVNLQTLWGNHAANQASLTFQQPFRVALHASRLIARSAA